VANAWKLRPSRQTASAWTICRGANQAPTRGEDNPGRRDQTQPKGSRVWPRAAGKAASTPLQVACVPRRAHREAKKVATEALPGPQPALFAPTEPQKDRGLSRKSAEGCAKSGAGGPGSAGVGETSGAHDAFDPPVRERLGQRRRKKCREKHFQCRCPNVACAPKPGLCRVAK
jgi:hypothetical protein